MNLSTFIIRVMFMRYFNIVYYNIIKINYLYMGLVFGPIIIMIKILAKLILS